MQELIWDRKHAATPKFDNHVLRLKEDQLARDFLTVANRFELCHQGSDMMIVSGGTVMKIDCIVDPSVPAKKAYYIAGGESNRRAHLMVDICRDLQMLVVGDFLKENGSKERALVI